MIIQTEDETVRIIAALKLLFPVVFSEKDAKKDGTFFIELISPDSEQSYDLLEWAVETYFRSCANETTRASQQLPAMRQQTELAMQLTSRFRAPSALVRYGASLILHTIVKLSPSFLDANKQLYAFVISGLLDADHQTAFLYESILLIADSPISAQIRQQISEVHRAITQTPTYDTLYMKQELISVSKYGLIDLISKQTPPIAPHLLEKMVSALEYLSLAAKLRQLVLIRFWGQATKLDAYVMQVLVPLCSSSTESIQIESIRVVASLLPLFVSANSTDIGFIWTYMHPLLDPAQKPNIILEAFELLRQFPLGDLSSLARQQVIDALFKLTFHPNVAVRCVCYRFLGGHVDTWKAAGETWKALGLLFSALGDADSQKYSSLTKCI